MSVTLQTDAMYLVFRQQVALRSTSLDEYFREVLVKENALQFGCWVEGDLDNLCLAIGISGEINDTRSVCACCDVVLAIASDA